MGEAAREGDVQRLAVGVDCDDGDVIDDLAGRGVGHGFLLGSSLAVRMEGSKDTEEAADGNRQARQAGRQPLFATTHTLTATGLPL